MIPVLLMLVYPGPDAARPDQPPPQRASDADRDIAADVLCAAVADGRLTLEELDARLTAALSARTITELATLIADLPDRPAPPPSIAPASRWSVIQSVADARCAHRLAGKELGVPWVTAGRWVACGRGRVQ